MMKSGIDFVGTTLPPVIAAGHEEVAPCRRTDLEHAASVGRLGDRRRVHVQAVAHCDSQRRPSEAFEHAAVLLGDRDR